jgi:hypothetical protein
MPIHRMTRAVANSCRSNPTKFTSAVIEPEKAVTNCRLGMSAAALVPNRAVASATIRRFSTY